MKPDSRQAELLKACPYRGLVPYFEDDADYFFGRKEDTGIIVANCLTTRVTLLYGASGVGKSSVLHAGVLRELRERAERSLAERECPECMGVAFSSWRDDPVEGLRHRIKEALQLLLPGSWTAKIPAGQGTLVEGLRVWTEFMQSDLVLLLDQFEEHFLYRNAHDTGFADELVQVVNDPTLRVNLLISIREDSLARLDTFKSSIPGLFDNCLRLDHLTVPAARLAIEGPLNLYNARHSEAAVGIEPQLVEQIIAQVQAGRVHSRSGGAGTVRAAAGRAGDPSRVEAPYLQIVMMRLWREDVAGGSRMLTAATLERLGGAQQIMRTHLDSVMRALPPKEQAVAAKVFHQLVTPSGTKIAHYVSDLAEFTGAPPIAVASMCDRLENWEARVLRDVTPPGMESKRYEIFHDLLAAPILDWRQRFLAAQHLRRRWIVLGSVLGAALVAGLTALFHAYAEARSLEKQKAKIEAESENRKEAGEASENWLALPEVREAIQKSAAVAAPPASVAALPQADFKDAATVVTGKVFRGHQRDVWGARYAADSRFLITAGRDSTARVWDMKGDSDFVLAGHTDEVNVAMLNPNPAAGVAGWFAATGSDDNTARVWKLAGDHASRPLVGHSRPISGLAWSRDGRWLITTSQDRTAAIWNVGGDLPERTAILQQHTDSVWAPALVETPNGAWLLTPSSDGTAGVWAFANGRAELRAVLPHGGAVRRVAMDATGTWVVTGGADGRAILWDRASGRKLLEAVHGGAVRDIAFHPTGSLFVTASSDYTAQVWNAETRTCVVVLQGHYGQVFSARFSPFGTGVVTASWDHTARLWDYAQKRCLAVLTGHTNVVWSVTFSPAGTNFCTTSADGTARLWDLKAISGTESMRPK